MKLWETIKRGVRKMLGLDEITQVVKKKPAISQDMYNEIQKWSAMYEGRAPWLRKPDRDNPVKVVSLGLPALIASEKARMATLEMESEITAPMIDEEKENPDYEPPGIDENGIPRMGKGSMTYTESVPTGPTERADFLNSQYKKVLQKIRPQLEYACAKGGIVIKPYVVIYEEGEDIDSMYKKEETKDSESKEGSVQDAEADAMSSSDPLPKYEFEFDFVQADRFFPMAFDSNGRITEAAFIQTKVENDKVYTRLEYHKLVGRTCTVQNYAFVSNDITLANGKSSFMSDTQLGREIPLTEVDDWANLAPEVEIEHVDRPLFAYLKISLKMPEANTIDTYSPIGVSCYSRVVDLIRDADEQYSRLLWEFEGGELAIDVDRDALAINELGETVLPTKQQRLFRKVDLNSEETYEVFSPALRDASIVNGLNTILTRIEDVTGLSRGTISNAEYTDARTATELKILKQRSFQTNKDIQQALKMALEDVVYVMNVYCDLYDIVSEGKYEISFEFDDSILIDSETELEKRMSMLSAGITSKVEIRMWYFGETENQAKEALQKIEDEKKSSMETNIMAQQEIGQQAQGKDFSGDNNNPGNQGQNNLENSKNNANN